MKIHLLYLSILFMFLCLYFYNKPNEQCLSQCSQDTMYSAIGDIQNYNELILKELEMNYQAYRNKENTDLYLKSIRTDSIAMNIITEIIYIKTNNLKDKKNLEKSIIELQQKMKTLEDDLYNGLYNLEKNADINEKCNRQLRHLGCSSSYLLDFTKLNPREQDEELVRICLEIRHKENYVLRQNKALISHSISCYF